MKVFVEDGAVLRQSILLTFAVCLTVSTAGAGNLLTNGDFESGTTGWTTWSWGPGYVGTAQDPAIQLDGKYLYAGQSGSSNGDGGAGAYQILAAEAGDTFYISAMAKAEGASPLATLVLVYLDGAQVEITRDEYEMANWAPLADWTFGELHGGPATAGTAYIKAEIANNGGRGTAYFDNVYADFGPVQPGPDYNADGTTNYLDFAKLALDWGESASAYNLAGNGGIDMDDLLAFAAQWLSTEPVDQFVWSDEFDGTTLNTANWEHMIGDGTSYGLPSGWGNNELQYYRSQNVSVADGYLTIEAREESYGGKNYTSGRIRSINKQDFLYGWMEGRIKVPTGGGMWPAFWMMPTDSVYGGWAASGEIDIMESCNDTDYAGAAIHFGGSWPDNRYSGGSYSPGGIDFSDDFHVYALEWEPDIIRWYVDDILYHTETNWWSGSYSDNGTFPAPFDEYFHFLLNVAVGGWYTGCTEPACITASFPQQMVVDYVRVYQQIP